MTLVEDVTAWVVGCGAEEAQQRSQEAEGGSHTRTVKPNSGSTAVSQEGGVLLLLARHRVMA
jgi:hypothetical protein